MNALPRTFELTDKVFRYDQGKFLIRLSGTDLAAGKKLIMRLRETITHGVASVGADGVAVPVTASFGIALLDPEVDALESIDRADHALTLARTAGTKPRDRLGPVGHDRRTAAATRGEGHRGVGVRSTARPPSPPDRRGS